MKTIERELTIEDAVSEALGEIQSLAEEMREAYDNTPESLQNSSVGEQRGEAADALESISEPSVPAELQGERFKVKWTERVLSPSAQRRRSRADRCSEAIVILTAVTEYLGDIEDNNDNTYTQEEQQAAIDFADDVQNVIDEAEAVEFPGMYG